MPPARDAASSLFQALAELFRLLELLGAAFSWMYPNFRFLRCDDFANDRRTQRFLAFQNLLDRFEIARRDAQQQPAAGLRISQQSLVRRRDVIPPRKLVRELQIFPTST